MMKIVKIPLSSLLDILTDLYDSGADYIDIEGQENIEGLELKDMMKIVVKPEYLSKDDVRDDHILTEEDDDNEEYEEIPSQFEFIDNQSLEIEMDYSDIEKITTAIDTKLSDDDINDLI